MTKRKKKINHVKKQNRTIAVISFRTTHRRDSPGSNTNRPAYSQLLKQHKPQMSHNHNIIRYTWYMLYNI